MALALALADATMAFNVAGGIRGSPGAIDGHAAREAPSSRLTAPVAERKPPLTCTS